MHYSSLSRFSFRQCYKCSPLHPVPYYPPSMLFPESKVPGFATIKTTSTVCTFCFTRFLLNTFIEIGSAEIGTKLRRFVRWMSTIIKLLGISEMLRGSLSFQPCHGMTDSSSWPWGNMPIGHVLPGSHPRFNDCSGSLNLSLWRPSILFNGS